jgi:hypothetical protein
MSPTNTIIMKIIIVNALDYPTYGYEISKYFEIRG